MLQKTLILIMVAILAEACAVRTPGLVAMTVQTTPSSPSREIAAALTTAASSTAQAGESDFLIGPGDVLDISVWKDEALARSCVVRPDGVISFPLIGEVRAGGMTVSQLRTDMEQKLATYVPDVVLTVEVKQVNSMLIYIIGKVKSPGKFILNANIDVLQALAMAGGLNEFANGNKIKVFRQENDETIMFPFEYDEVVEGKRLEQNINLKRGDIVVVP
jgi:polysaccharide export outer membrane protein